MGPAGLAAQQTWHHASTTGIALRCTPPCPLVQRFPEVPRLTPKQLEALQAVTDLADSPELHLDWGEGRPCVYFSVGLTSDAAERGDGCRFEWPLAAATHCS